MQYEDTSRLALPAVERVATAPGLGPGASGLERPGDRRSAGRDARRGELVARAGPCGGRRCPASPPPPGATPKLTGAQRAQLPTWLAYGPKRMGSGARCGPPSE